MTWKQFLTSSLGKKFVMGFTGLFLLVYLIIHAWVNGLIFYNDNGEMFNSVAYFLAHNLLIRILEIGLFAGFALHIVQGLLLWKQNSAARPVGYKVNRANTNSKWYSRSMGLLGTIILIFLIVHLAHFWYGTKVALYVDNNLEQHNLYHEMQEVFTNPLIVAFYLIGLISLFFHLVHGFQSAFQTFGINHKKYTPMIKAFGWIYSIVICVAFALMPLAVHFRWLD